MLFNIQLHAHKYTHALAVNVAELSMSVHLLRKIRTYHLSCFTAGSSDEQSHLCQQQWRGDPFMTVSPTFYPHHLLLHYHPLVFHLPCPIWCSVVSNITMLRFLSPSWIAANGRRISPNSSPIKSRRNVCNQSHAFNLSVLLGRRDRHGKGGVRSVRLWVLVDVYISV